MPPLTTFASGNGCPVIVANRPPLTRSKGSVLCRGCLRSLRSTQTKRHGDAPHGTGAPLTLRNVPAVWSHQLSAGHRDILGRILLCTQVPPLTAFASGNGCPDNEARFRWLPLMRELSERMRGLRERASPDNLRSGFLGEVARRSRDGGVVNFSGKKFLTLALTAFDFRYIGAPG